MVFDLGSASERDILALGEPSDEFRKILDKIDTNTPLWGAPTIDEDLQPQMQKEAEKLEYGVFSDLGADDPAIAATDTTIKMRDGHVLPIRITSSATEPKQNRPLVVCFHGGGFYSGTIYNVEPYARGIIKLFNAVVVAPTYRFSPKNRFPQGVEDAWDAVRWAAKNAKFLGADPTAGFILSGGSAGGNFACVLATRAKNEQLNPPLSGVWTCIPLLFNRDVDGFEKVDPKYKMMQHSWKQNAKSPVLNADSISAVLDWYRPDFGSPLWNPFNAPEPFEGLPKTFIQVAGMDLIRDDGLAYGKALIDSGVETRVNAYSGVPHAFWIFFQSMAICREFMDDIGFGFAWLLGRSVTKDQVRKAMQYPGVTT